jgi:hypothetical protein
MLTIKLSKNNQNIYTFVIHIGTHKPANFSTNNHLAIRICMSLNGSLQDLSNDTNYIKFGQDMSKLWSFLCVGSIKEVMHILHCISQNLHIFTEFTKFPAFLDIFRILHLSHGYITFMKSHVANNST